jgi:2-haloacid dehalogenase
MTTELDYGAFDALTFDCYGTLIDWEAGILAGLRSALAPHGVDAADDELLESYAHAEAALEAGPYLRYREVLAGGARAIASRLGTTLSDDEAAAFGGSVVDWPAFPDSHDSLVRLKKRFRLGVLTNCDDDLFAASNRRLGVAFDWIVTAQQVGSYKPDERNFAALFERLGSDAVPPDRILHVAQSLFHDHVPARRLGLRSVWIDRRHGRPGAGATPPADARPDATFGSTAAFADAATGRQGQEGDPARASRI